MGKLKNWLGCTTVAAFGVLYIVMMVKMVTLFMGWLEFIIRLLFSAI